MGRRVLVAAAVCASALYGCASWYPGGDKGVAPSLRKVCLAPDTSEARCKVQAGQRFCNLTVINSSGGALVYPYKLRLPQHGPNRSVTIVWELVNAGLLFDESRRDGPVQLLTDSRFKNGWPSNDPNGATHDPSGKYFRIEFDNAASTGVSGIDYQLQFSTPGGGQVNCDPNITNESG